VNPLYFIPNILKTWSCNSKKLQSQMVGFRFATTHPTLFFSPLNSSQKKARGDDKSNFASTPHAPPLHPPFFKEVKRVKGINVKWL